MSDQPRLPFNGEPPHVAGSDTSEDAAHQMRASAASLRAKVLRVLTERGPSTCDEVEVALNMRHQTASARIRELAIAGRIVDSNVKRRTRSKRKAIVWAIVVAAS
jgi:predicted transcriptional regulator